jgi:hypothetical protein
MDHFVTSWSCLMACRSGRGLSREVVRVGCGSCAWCVIDAQKCLMAQRAARSAYFWVFITILGAAVLCGRPGLCLSPSLCVGGFAASQTRA